MRSVRLHRASRVVHKVSAVREQRRSSVAHWAAGADGRGALLTGDTIAIGADLASVNLMRSYVNNIPLPERAVRRVLAAVDPYQYDRIYGAFRSIDAGGASLVTATLERYRTSPITDGRYSCHLTRRARVA